MVAVAVLVKRLIFVTSNKGKLKEAEAKFGPLGYQIEGRNVDPVEIQADRLEDIARAKALACVGELDAPFLVDDGGLFIEALKGFPGVFSAHALKTIGVDGILRLMGGVEDRRAHFAAVVAYWDGENVHTFGGRCDGRLIDEKRSGGHGFGFDPIFVPEGYDRTFAEISAEDKNALSHRGRALSGLVAHLRGG